MNNLGVSSANLSSAENPMEIVKPKPIIVQKFVPNEPIFLSAEQWNAVCDKTKDASLPFTVEITVTNKEKEDDNAVEEEKEEIQEEVYVPRKRKTKK